MLSVAKKKLPEKRRAVTVRLPDKLVTDAENFSERHHRSFTALVELAITEYLKRYGHLPPLEESIEE